MNSFGQAASIVAPIEKYFEALNAHDLDSVVGVFTVDATLMPNEAESAVGIAEVRAAYAHRFTVFDYDRELHIDDWVADGDVAVVRCHTTGSFTMRRTGTMIDAISRELFALQRSNGHWKIRFYMFNRTTPA